MTTKLLGALFLLLAFAGIAFGVGALTFYRGGYEPPAPIQAELPEQSPPVVPGNTVWESPVDHRDSGLFLIDALHRNAFTPNHVSALRSKVADLGFDVEFLGGFGNVKEEDRLPLLEEKLRVADSFAVILPRVDYTAAEATLVENFVRKGGKLLLISDPGLTPANNTLAVRFGVNFQPDYLYNQFENDINFQNIFVKDFQPGEITVGVNEVALYSAGSIRSSGPGLAFADENTRSSLLQHDGDLSPMAFGDTRNVLALGDFTFMVPPQNAALDNDRLLSNIARYLTESDRVFDLADFPHFFQSGPDNTVDVLPARSELLTSGTQVKNGLASLGVTANISGVEDVSRNTVFLGLHEDAPLVSRYLQGAGVSVGEVLTARFVPDLELKDTSITILAREQERYVLIILSETAEVMEKAVERLLEGDFRNDLVSEFAGVNNSP